MSTFSSLLFPAAGGPGAAPERPVIGINLDFEAEPAPRSMLRETYYDAVWRGGGLPVLLAPIADEAAVAELLSKVQGLVMTGGDDLDPAHWGEDPHPACKLLARRREKFDLLLARAALARRVPLLAICCGTQLLNVVRGGTLLQDLPSLAPSPIVHKAKDGEPAAEHEVDVVPGTRLRAIVGADRIRTNSIHHQAIRKLGEGLVVSARAEDGVIEAWEDPDHPFLLGVQWHPERLPDEPPHRALFEAHAAAAARHGR
jgi:putative glutamine amidotransferase